MRGIGCNGTPLGKFRHADGSGKHKPSCTQPLEVLGLGLGAQRLLHQPADGLWPGHAPALSGDPCIQLCERIIEEAHTDKRTLASGHRATAPFCVNSN